MNAITVLKNDHKQVERIFKQFERLGDGAHKTKRKLVDEMIVDLSVHAAIEETVFYPRTRWEVQTAEDVVLESLEEHHIVKWTLSELEKMDPSDERFDAKVTVLMESVRHHVKEEEEELFPEVSKRLSRKELNELGDELEAVRKIAPKRPHPKAPDEPPGNLVATAVSLPGDLAKEAVKKTVRTAAGKVARVKRGRG
jgi:hemerythrin superfamily protein